MGLRRKELSSVFANLGIPGFVRPLVLPHLLLLRTSIAVWQVMQKPEVREELGRSLQLPSGSALYCIHVQSCIDVHTYRHNILTSSLTYNKFGWSLIFVRRELSSSSSPSSSPPTKAASTSSTASERHASILQIMRSTRAWVASWIIIAHN